MPDYLKLVKEKKDENDELLTRMQVDEDLLYLKKYIMLDKDERPVPNIINVTLNRPAVFAANIISALGTTTETRTVTSDDENLDTTDIEDVQKAAFASANKRLNDNGKTELNPFFDTQLCIRGGAAARCLFRMENDVLIPDIVPWDRRFTTYQMSPDGMAWGGYETTRSRAVIEAQYGITVAGKFGTVLDVWDKEHNEIWINKTKQKEQEHQYGFTPVVIEIVPLGYGTILLSEDRVKNEGESIFFLIRGAIPELNRLISILQTLNLKAVMQPMKQKKRGGGKASKHSEITGLGAVTAMEVDEDIAGIDYGDAKRSATIGLDMIDQALREGSLSSADLGLIGSPPASGVRAIIAGENKDQVVRPRLEAKAGINEQLTRMFTKQILQIGGTLELGTPGHKKSFSTSILEGEYETKYRYTARSPVTDAGLYSLAASAGNALSEKYKRENIYQLEDPDGEENQLRWEEAERISPAIKINRTIQALMVRAKDGDEDAEFEAELMSAEMGINLEQMLSGEVPTEQKPEKRDEPTQVLSLFGGQAGGGQQQAPTEEE